MTTTTIDHNKLTPELLEEFVEFIDWGKVPSQAITEEIKAKFSFIKELRARLWFDDLLSKMCMYDREDLLCWEFEGEIFIEIYNPKNSEYPPPYCSFSFKMVDNIMAILDKNDSYAIWDFKADLINNHLRALGFDEIHYTMCNYLDEQ